MSDAREIDGPPGFDGVSRLLVAAATAALAVSAQRWAVGGAASYGILSPVQIAAIAGLSAMLGGAKFPLLVRVALHLGALWILRETLGDGWDGSTRCGLFIVSAAAFLGAPALAGLAARPDRCEASDDAWRKLTTGDLLAALFAFSVYVAIGQHEAAFVGHETLRIAELAVRHLLLPYAILLLAERWIGRGGASVTFALAAVAISLTIPHLSPIDPFAAALLAALRIATGRLATAGACGTARDDRSLA